jgi:phosphatidylglycerophosphatase A
MRRFIAAGFGVGLLPRRLWGSDNGAGTFGAVLAGIIALVLAPLGWGAHLAATAVMIGLSLWSPGPFLAEDDDPGWITIDEVAGAMVALTGLAGWPWVVAWIVARLADIFKVLPGVPQAERLHGAIGITADDVVAGVYGLAAGWILTWLL